MRTFLAIALSALGIMIMVGGGLGLLVFGLYDIFTNIETIDGWRLFRDILFVCGGDVVAFVVGFFVFTFGFAFSK